MTAYWLLAAVFDAVSIALLVRFAKTRRPGWILGAVLSLAAGGVAAFAGVLEKEERALADERARDRERFLTDRVLRLTCAERLAELARIYVERRRARGPSGLDHDGVALLFSWRKSEGLLKRGQEELLRCPGDPSLRPLDDSCRAAYDAVDLDHPPTDLCSYAVRDFAAFPMPAEGAAPEIVMCCRQGKDGRSAHHVGGINVAFSDGRVKFMTREDLGINREEAITVGPEATVQMLKMVRASAP